MTNKLQINHLFNAKEQKIKFNECESSKILPDKFSGNVLPPEGHFALWGEKKGGRNRSTRRKPPTTIWDHCEIWTRASRSLQSWQASVWTTDAPTATSILLYNSFRISSVKTNNLIIDYFRMLSHRIWHKLFAQTAMDLGIALCLIYPYPYPSLHSYLQIPRD